jgi:hypothetical protein
LRIGDGGIDLIRVIWRGRVLTEVVEIAIWKIALTISERLVVPHKGGSPL